MRPLQTLGSKDQILNGKPGLVADAAVLEEPLVFSGVRCNLCDRNTREPFGHREEQLRISPYHGHRGCLLLLSPAPADCLNRTINADSPVICTRGCTSI